MADVIDDGGDQLVVPVMPSSERRRRKAAIAVGTPFAIALDVVLFPLQLPVLLLGHAYGRGP